MHLRTTTYECVSSLGYAFSNSSLFRSEEQTDNFAEAFIGSLERAPLEGNMEPYATRDSFSDAICCFCHSVEAA